jgi:hypothetical protein
MNQIRPSGTAIHSHFAASLLEALRLCLGKDTHVKGNRRPHAVSAKLCGANRGGGAASLYHKQTSGGGCLPELNKACRFLGWR